MKKILLTMVLATVAVLGADAQKYALIDMEYILGKIPAYERANEQLNQLSEKWQAEVEALSDQAESLYKQYQSQAVFYSEEQKAKKEEEIMQIEKNARELKRKYFDVDGELYKKRESLMAPILDEIYEAVKGISEQAGYYMVIDRSSAQSVIFASPKADISNTVLQKLGYSN